MHHERANRERVAREAKKPTTADLALVYAASYAAQPRSGYVPAERRKLARDAVGHFITVVEEAGL